jgi:hypothetical protein
MCSYLAMFPPALPRYFIEQCSRPGDTVLDPFSGRGTTALEACLANRIGLGSDANPLAAVLTAAKTRFPSYQTALDRLNALEYDYDPDAAATQTAPAEIRLLFHEEHTLPQLLYLRSTLSRRSNCDNFLLASLAGILHGNHPKNPENARTLSISMPNTFSMSPAYIGSYVDRNNLQKFPFDCFSSLRRRLDYLYRDGTPGTSGRASERDARTVGQWLKRDSVDLVVTSPPYLRVMRYGKYNWIRLWLLRRSVEDVDRRIQVEATDHSLRLTDYLKFPRYHQFIEQVLLEIAKVTRPGGTVVLVIGDVKIGGDEFPLALRVWDEVRRRVPYRLIDCLEDSIALDGKVTRIWGSRRGHATRTDRILVLRRHGGRGIRPQTPSRVLQRMHALT